MFRLFNNKFSSTIAAGTQLLSVITVSVQLRTLGRRITISFPGKAVNQDTCDQAISQDGEVCEHLILDLPNIMDLII